MMIKNTIGWLSILLATLSLAPSFVPGAMSVMGLLVSLTALVISIFSVSYNKSNYYKITFIIVIVGVVFINDALRIWQPLPMPFNVKITMYSIFFLVVLVCMIFAKKLSNDKKVT